LWWACNTSGDAAIVASLLKAGAKADARDAGKAGSTPLIRAARSGHAHLVALLVGAGANIEATNNSGNTPLIVCCQNAANKGNEAPKLATVQALLLAGADVKAAKGGWTAMHWCANYGWASVVPALAAVGFGATEAKTDDTHATPLILACSNVNGAPPAEFDLIAEPTVRALLEAGAYVAATTESGESALWCACKEGLTEAVKALLAVGADTKPQRKDNWSALHAAAQNGHADLVPLLAAAGADLEAVGKAPSGKKFTPLSKAEAKGHENVGLALRALGATK